MYGEIVNKHLLHTPAETAQQVWCNDIWYW